MADPLSIAAGVTGIVTAAAKISSLLVDFMVSTKRAPEQARVIYVEISDINGIMSQLQSFLLGIKSLKSSRASLLQVDQVITTITSCVHTLSELEKLLDDLKLEGMGVLECIAWARKEASIVKVIQRLQNHKASLSLMLSILNGYGVSLDHENWCQ